MTSRRAFARGGLAAAGVALLAGCGVPLGPLAQRPRLRRVGVLAPGGETSNPANVAAFRQGLRELGYVEGSDVALELRYGDGRADRIPALAAELVRLGVDVLVTAGTEGIRAVAEATRTIPIVFLTAGPDPVADGLVASLARPGGNVTGITLYAGEEHAKRVQVLKEGLPDLNRVGVLWNQAGQQYLDETEAAARALGVQVVDRMIRGPDDLDGALAGLAAGRVEALVVTSGAVFSFLATRIVAWAAQQRLPAIYGISTFAGAGGLLVYGASIPANYHRGATFVDKILRGASPADLPVERPTRFDFVVNLQTAEALGLTLPPSILQQATEVIR